MRQAWVHHFAFGVRQTNRRVHPRVRPMFFAGITAAGLFLLPVVVSAESLKSETSSAETRKVSPAKRVVLLPREARATQQAKNFVSIGPIFGFTTHVESSVTGMLGLEVSYVRYPYAAFGFGMGGFVQGQTVGFNHARFAFGPQFNFMMFGAEIGAYLEEGSGHRATTVGSGTRWSASLACSVL